MGMRGVLCAALVILAFGCVPPEAGGGDGGGGGGLGLPPFGSDPGCRVEFSGPEFAAIDTCTGNDICICPGSDSCPSGGGTCEPAFGRRYEVVVSAADYPERKSNGDCWDIGCGAPDPFVNVWVDGDFVGGTPVRQDTFHPTWDPDGSGELGRATILAGSVFDLEASDADVSFDDGGIACHQEFDAEMLRGRNIVCRTADWSFVVFGSVNP